MAQWGCCKICPPVIGCIYYPLPNQNFECASCHSSVATNVEARISRAVLGTKIRCALYWVHYRVNPCARALSGAPDAVVMSTVGASPVC